MRILGPPRSSSTPTLTPARSVASRTSFKRRPRSSRVPCEALSRTTFTPAWIMSRSTPGSSVAGPAVATIFVRLEVSMSARCASLQNGDGGELAAFHEFEEGATAGGDVGDAVLDAVFLDSRERVAAAGEREGLAARDRIRDGASTLAELVVLEDPDRPVPDDGTRGLESAAPALGRVRADVENALVRPDFVDRANVRMRRRRQLLRDDHIARQGNLRAAVPRLRHELARNVEHIGLLERLAHLDTRRREEGVGDAASDEQAVDLREQRLEHRELRRYLRSGDDRDERPGRTIECALERL